MVDHGLQDSQLSPNRGQTDPGTIAHDPSGDLIPDASGMFPRQVSDGELIKGHVQGIGKHTSRTLDQVPLLAYSGLGMQIGVHGILQGRCWGYWRNWWRCCFGDGLPDWNVMVLIIPCTFPCAGLFPSPSLDQCGIHSRQSDMVPDQFGIRSCMKPSLEFALSNTFPMPCRNDSPILMQAIPIQTANIPKPGHDTHGRTKSRHDPDSLLDLGDVVGDMSLI